MTERKAELARQSRIVHDDSCRAMAAIDHLTAGFTTSLRTGGGTPD
jgi:hypothetical protein